MADRIEPTTFSREPPPIPVRRHRGGNGWFGLLAVAVLAGGIFWWLNRDSGEASPPEPEAVPVAETDPLPVPEAVPVAEVDPISAPAPAPVPEPAKSPGQLLLERKQAEEALTRYLGAKREAEALAVTEWGGDDYAAVLGEVEQADAAYSAEDFPAAATGYDTARRGCERLVEGADDAFAGLMEGAGVALAEADGVTAERLFTAAAAIRPDDADAKTGLRRSKTIEVATRLLQTGSVHEDNELLELALVDYQEALRLDPFHPEARASAARVVTTLRDLTFREAMSDALAALNEGRLTAARERVLQARAVRPEAPEVADALFRITEAERRVKIDAVGERARAAEAEEAWAKAHAAYREILAIDANVAFAREGADRCATCVQLAQQIAHFVKDPALLTAPEGRAEARNLVTEAEGLGLEAPKLAGQVAALSAALVRAETKVPVALTSDGNTRVDIYKVGRYAPFTSQELALLPGTYTVVGHRPGYRDVRMELQVEPGADTVRATVICRERI